MSGEHQVSSDHEQTYPYYRSPASIRAEDFSHRMRGLDEEEVREYLNMLADQVEAFDHERHQLHAECQRLRAEVEEHRASADRANEQSVAILSQAQLVAEEMVEEVGRETRERMTQARSNEREILQEALDTAKAIRREADAAVRSAIPAQQSYGASAPTPDSPFARVAGGGGHGGPGSSASAEVEQVRAFALAAQAQMQQIMDALTAQVARMGDSDASYGGPRGQDGISVAAWRSWQGDAHSDDHRGPWDAR
jgi:DivIVA domain-containing protein